MHWSARSALRHLRSKQFIKSCRNSPNLDTHFTQIRCLSTISPFNSSLLSSNYCFQRKRFDFCSFQKRDFIAFGDGEEGNALSKVYDERRVLGYSPEQLYAVVAAVDLYEGFLPWCQRSEILRRFPDGTFEAELEIGFKFLVESFVTHVEMRKPNYVKTSASQCHLFDHLINIWEFNPGPVPGSCHLYVHVDFKFHSTFYYQIAIMFFNEVVARLVRSCEERCLLIYGPAIRLEQSYQH